MVNCYLITALIERRKWMEWVLFGGERAHKGTEELAQHGSAKSQPAAGEMPKLRAE